MSGKLRAASEILAPLRGIVVETLRGFRDDRGFDLAASLAFTTLITAVPLLATFSIVVAALFREKDEEVLAVINWILPYHTAIVTETLRQFIVQSLAISGVGAILLLLASTRLISAVEKIFNAVWGAPARHARVRRMAIHIFVLVVLALLTGAIALGFPRFTAVPFVEGLFPFGVELVALLLLYRYLPNALVHWRSAAAAAFVIAIFLELLRVCFRLYVEALSKINMISGSLSFALLVLVSIYCVWVLILLGVELTHVLQNKLGRWRAPYGKQAGRAENAIRMLLRLAAGSPQRLRELYREQEASSVEAERILQLLREKGLVKGDARGFTLARLPQEVTVASVVEAVSPNLYTITADPRDRVVRVLEPLFQRLDAERRTLLKATLADLLERPADPR